MPPAPTFSPILVVALQEGFDGDAVRVRVDGDEVFREEALTTDTRIGLATSFEVPVEKESVVLEVKVPGRGLTSRTTIQAGGPLYLGISLADDSIQFRASEQPFGYL